MGQGEARGEIPKKMEMEREKKMLKCAIIGAAGYTGIELTKILLTHPKVRITALSEICDNTPFPVQTLIPDLPSKVRLEVRPYTFSELRQRSDAVFLCLPHTKAMEMADQFYQAGKIVIDLSADLRLQDWKEYEAWYGVKHSKRELLKNAVYGLPELFRRKIQKARLIANPGCYPTGVVLGIVPLLREGLVEADSIVIDSKSGVSGAGKRLTPATHFCEVDQNFYAYKVNRHQHKPEIEQTLSVASGRPTKVTFVTHLLPVTRGILSTIYLKRHAGVKPARIRKALLSAYGKEPFVRLKPEGMFPALKDVRLSNYCDIGLAVDDRSDRVIVVTAIDNLVKGASGQAVQNMNIVCGFPETEGLIP